MSELLREWLLGITCAAMLLSLAESLAPEGGAKKMVNLAGGLVLILAAINPVVKLDETVLADITREFETEVRTGTEELKENNAFLYESIIQEKTAAYILDKAEELGMDCRVTVSVAWDGELPKPYSVKIFGKWSRDQRNTLSRFLESELGILIPMQHFEETDQ